MNQNQHNLNEMLDFIKMEYFDNVDNPKSKYFQFLMLQEFSDFSLKKNKDEDFLL